MRNSLARIGRSLFAVDARALAVMRIGCATAVLIDLVGRARFLLAHYTGEGALPRELLIHGDYVHLSLHLLNDSVTYQSFLFLLTGLIAVMVLLGWKTRVTTIALWFLVVSLHARNPLVVFHGDIELRLLLFFAMFLPWGRRYSLDARNNAAERNSLIFSAASAALLLQVAFVYLFAATEKSASEWRVEGSAIYLALSNMHFGNAFGHMLTAYPAFLSALTFCVLWLQQLSFLLLFWPIRTDVVRGVAVTLLLLMQLGFTLTMKLSFFPLVSMVALLAFIPSRVWDAVETRFQKRLWYGKS